MAPDALPKPGLYQRRYDGVPRADLERRLAEAEAARDRLVGQVLHWECRAEVAEGLVDMLAGAFLDAELPS